MPAYTNAKQVIPPLFQEIVKADERLAEMRASPVVGFFEGSRLVRERRDFSRAAEKALSWNTNKGTAE